MFELLEIKTKRKIQIVIDVSMTFLLPLLMAYSMIGEISHEWLGIMMILLVVVHNVLNVRWFTMLFMGRYTPIRTFRTIINVLLLFNLLSLMISGIILSRYALEFLPIYRGYSLARVVHLLSSYWGFLLMSVHIGLHWSMILGMIKRTAHREKSVAGCRIILRFVSAILCCYGIHAFVQRQLGTYLLLKSEFVFFDFGEPFLYFVFDYAAIMFLFACLGYCFSKLMKAKKKKVN